MNARLIPTRDGAIRLGQFLKLANVIDSGSDAKILLGEERVQVNGVLETRRGRQLTRGDLVIIDEMKFEVG
jgi:ribosome-associated protein